LNQTEFDAQRQNDFLGAVTDGKVAEIGQEAKARDDTLVHGAVHSQDQLVETGRGKQQRNERVCVGSRSALGPHIKGLYMPAVGARNVLKEALKIIVTIELNILSKKL
jgi:hypothetical protein